MYALKDTSALLDVLSITFEGNATYTQNFQHESIKPQNVYSQRDGTFPETRRLTIKKKDDRRETRSSWGGLRYLKRHPYSNGKKIISKEVGNRNSKTACAQETFTWQKRSTLLIKGSRSQDVHSHCNLWQFPKWQAKMIPLTHFVIL